MAILYFLRSFSGLGASMVGIIPSQSIISKWFNKKLSSALSIAYSGQGLGVLILAPLCQILISKYGWKLHIISLVCSFLGF